MKKLYQITFTILFFCVLNTVYAQTADYFNYQAVIRSSDGTIMQDQEIRVQFTIENQSGTVFLVEEQEATSDAYGVINISVGKGTVVSGSWNTINWEDELLLLVDIDYNKDGTFDLNGTNLISPVPKANFAKKALIADDLSYSLSPVATSGNYADLGNKPQLTLEGDSLGLEGSNKVFLPATGKDSLILDGTTLSIVGSNSVELPSATGTGDMLKSQYDADNNGLVDEAQNSGTVNNLTVNTAVPVGAIFTDDQSAAEVAVAPNTTLGLTSDNVQAALEELQGKITNGGVADATTDAKGVVQLSGDLGGTAESPTIAAGAVTNDKLAVGVDAAKLADGSVSNTELQYLGNVTGDLQLQLDSKANASSLSDIATSGDYDDLVDKPINIDEDKTDDLLKTDLVNDLTSGGTTKVLTSEQGKILKDALDQKAAANSVYTKAEADNLLSGKVGLEAGKGLSTNDYTTAEKTLVAGAEQTVNKNAVNGYVGLDANKKIDVSQLPAITINNVFTAANESIQLGLSAHQGDVAIRTDISKNYIHNGGNAGTMADWTELASPDIEVTSVNGKTGNVVIGITDIATLQTILNEKANASSLSTVAITGSYNDLQNIPMDIDTNATNDLLQSDVVNDLTTGGSTKVLSAEQGKVLKTSVDANATAISDNITDITTNTANISQNTSDITLKENTANKSTDGTLASESDVLFPTEKAVKTYVDNTIASGAPDATTTTKGKIQLVGDLTGTADVPLIANDAVTTDKIATATANQVLTTDASGNPQWEAKTTLTGDLASKLALTDTATILRNEIADANTDVNNLQSELDATQTGSGLGTDGSYAPNTSTNYMKTSSSLVDATEDLDEQLKINADSIDVNAAAIAANTSDISDNADEIALRATQVALEDTTTAVRSSIDANAANIALNATKAELADTATVLRSEINAANTIGTTLQSELDATQTGSGLGTDGSYAANTSTNYMKTSSSLVDATEDLDDQVKLNADSIAVNAADIETNTTAIASNTSDISDNADEIALRATQAALEDTTTAVRSSIDANSANIALNATKVALADTAGVLRGEIAAANTIGTSLQSELDATQTGAGLGSDGSYAPNTSTNYMKTSSSLVDATEDLDAQIKTNADSIAVNAADIETNTTAITSNTSDISDNADEIALRATQVALEDTTTAVRSAIDANAANIALNATKLALADTASDLRAEIEAANTAGENLQTELDATQTGAGLEADGTYAANTSTNYIKTSTSLVEATEDLDDQVKLNADSIAINSADIATNASDISDNTAAIALRATQTALTDTAIAIRGALVDSMAAVRADAFNVDNLTDTYVPYLNGSGLDDSPMKVAAGKVGIATTSAPTQALDVNGNINIAEDNTFMIGDSTVLKIGPSITSTGVGIGASTTSTSNTTSVGYHAGFDSQQSNHVFVGAKAGENNKGHQMTALGYNAGRNNIGHAVVAIGSSAGDSLRADQAVVIGWQAGQNNAGEASVAIGSEAGQNNLGIKQIALGSEAGRDNEGTGQISIGYASGIRNLGAQNITIGNGTGIDNKGDNVISLGYLSTRLNKGSDVVAIGYEAGYNNNLDNQFIVQQRNINATPLIRGDFATGNLNIAGKITAGANATANMDLVTLSQMNTAIGAATTDNLTSSYVPYYDGTKLTDSPLIVSTGKSITLLNENDGLNIRTNSESDRTSLSFYRGRGTNTARSASLAGDKLGVISFRGATDSGATSFAGSIEMVQEGTTGTNTYVPAKLSFYTSNGSSSADYKERLTITSAGNVGIGTVSPTEKLDVAGNIKASGRVSAGANATADMDLVPFKQMNDSLAVVRAGGLNVDNLTSAYVPYYDGTGFDNSRITINGTNVGIGTTTPSSDLHIKVGSSGYSFPTNTDGLIIEDPAEPQLFLSGSSNTRGYINFGDNINNKAGRLVYDNYVNAMAFFTNGNNERMRIDSAGNVGIGTPDTKGKLALNSTVSLNAASLGMQENYALNLDNTSANYTGDWSGISFSASANYLNVGASIIHRRKGSESAGNLEFYTKTSTVRGAEPQLAMRLTAQGNMEATGKVTAGANATANMDLVPLAQMSDSLAALRADGVSVDNLTSAYVPYFDGSGLDNSPVAIADTSVGIGTTTPKAALHVKTGSTGHSLSLIPQSSVLIESSDDPHLLLEGGAGSTGQILFGDDINYKKAAIKYVHSDDAMTFITNGPDVERMRITSTGNVGIGTSDPASTLHIKENAGTGLYQLIIDNHTSMGGYKSGIGFRVADDANNSTYVKSAIFFRRELGGIGTLNFAMNNVSGDGNVQDSDVKMTLNRMGNLGIGTTSPSEKLDVAGNIKASGSLTIAGNLAMGAGNYINADGDNEGLSFDADGKGTFSTDLTVNGNTFFPSDRRLKTNIETLSDVIDKINRIRGVRFEFKDQTKYATGPKIGVIAQELQKVYPELVTEGADGFLKVDYTQLTGILLQAVKEQQKEIDTLKQQMEMVMKKLDIK